MTRAAWYGELKEDVKKVMSKMMKCAEVGEESERDAAYRLVRLQLGALIGRESQVLFNGPVRTKFSLTITPWPLFATFIVTSSHAKPSKRVPTSAALHPHTSADPADTPTSSS